MGLCFGKCFPCFGGNSDEDEVPEVKRKKLREAAEKRLAANKARGVKDPELLERKQKRQEELEQKQEELERLERVSGRKGGNLQWTVD